MFSEKIDYERIRRLILQNLEQLHSEVFKIKEEVSNLHAWNAVMYRMIYNQSLSNLEKKIQTLEDKLSKLRDELDRKDDSPIESSRIRKDIQNTLDELNKLKDKLPVDPKSDKAKELLINNLIKFETKQKGFANEALEISIQNSYQGVFEPKKNSYNNNFTNNDRPSFLDTYQHILNK